MQAGNSRNFAVLMTAVVSAGLAVGAFALPQAELRPSLMFAAAAIALEASPARMNPEMRVSLAIVADLVALVYGGLDLMIVTALGTAFVTGLSTQARRVTRGTFNAGMFALSSLAAALTYTAVTGTGLFGPPSPSDVLDNGTWFVGLLAAAVAYTIVNTVLLASVLNVTSSVPLRQTLKGLWSQVSVLQMLYAGLAAIAFVLLVRVGPASLILMTVPLLVARRALLGVQKRQAAFDKMVRAFVKAIEVKDGYTRGHAERVAELSRDVAAKMGMTYEERQLIYYGAILHDVGKIGVSLGVLCKAGPLTDDEFGEMKLHPEIGAEMLHDIDFLKPVLSIVRHHHERLDGRGYPSGLEGDEIPVVTRIVSTVDAFDAMTSTRSYRKALPVEVALTELQDHAGTQFDAEVVGHLVELIRAEGWELTDEPVASVPVMAVETAT